MFLALSAIFIVIRLAPGDPVARILGDEATLEEINRLREQMGLNLSLLHQYWQYVIGLFTGELGESFFKHLPVYDLIIVKMKPSAILAFVSIFISSFLGILLGTTSAAYKSKVADNIIRVMSLICLSFPIFSLAPILVFIFAIKYDLLPVSEWGDIQHMILPIMTLVLPLSAIIIRVMRNRYLEEITSPWVQVLEAKGMSKIGIHLRLVKISMPTILNVIAIQLSVVLAGTMITETIYDIPGMGMLLFEGIQNRDYPVVQGVIAYSTVIYMIIYFIVDYVNTKIDPRIEN